MQNDSEEYVTTDCDEDFKELQEKCLRMKPTLRSDSKKSQKST